MAMEPSNDDDAAEAKAMGRALSVIRARAGISQEQAGERLGISGEGYRKYEAGTSAGVFRPHILRRLARALNTSLEQIVSESGLSASFFPTAMRGDATLASEAVTALLPIRDRVQAGAWLMADDFGQDTPKRYPAARDPRYAHAEQWLSEVVGDSLNKLNIVDGDLVHCVDVVALGYYPKNDDIVEVERRRFSGSERELTIKQVEVTPFGIKLWPRSTNLRWQSPIELREGLSDNEDVEVAIRGLVIASIRRF